jgi:hypothetical protein
MSPTTIVSLKTIPYIGFSSDSKFNENLPANKYDPTGFIRGKISYQRTVWITRQGLWTSPLIVT